ncbi:aldehyde dehydrogenase family protein [Streptomyces sp. NPDC057696]|uniref:aldehyde dehydrogenase family protein n=1 Tax=Streptomyces sp. NPDC057696 TaxID=3346218 RepID=UPI003675E0A1
MVRRQAVRRHEQRHRTVTNPATGETTGRVALTNLADARTVIGVARSAFPAWRDTSLTRRTQIVFWYRELLNERKNELARIITAEHKSVWVADSDGHVNTHVATHPWRCPIEAVMGGSARRPGYICVAHPRWGGWSVLVRKRCST